MSDTDSFIEEVTEEVRRDRMFAMMKRYGWIAAIVVVGLVGGAAANEIIKSRKVAAAQDLGDEIIAALGSNDSGERASALTKVTSKSAGGAAIVDLLTASAESNSDQLQAAVDRLAAVSSNGEIPEIYRQIATFKSLNLQAETMPAAERRLQYEALSQPGSPLRLLAQEQLALIDIAEGQGDAALDRLQAILLDAETDAALRDRVSQLVVALGGTPEVLPGLQQG